MTDPATDATENIPTESETVTEERTSEPVPTTENIMDSSETKESTEAVPQEAPVAITPKDLKTFKTIAWLSVVLSFLPLIILVVIADGYDSIQKFSPTESLFFPVVMFAISYIGSRYSRKANNSVTKGLNALFGTFYIFLLMLYFASGVVGINAVLIIPLIIPVILPVVFLWLLGTKVTLSKLRKNPVDEEGNPIDPNKLDPMKETLPDKTFAEIVFQIIGVFLAIGLGYFITAGIIALI